MTPSGEVNVGIDLAQRLVDVAVHRTGSLWTMRRTRSGLHRLRARLQALQPTRIVLEATGGYERAVVAALRGCRWSWSIRAGPATWPAPTAPWPRPIGWTPKVALVACMRTLLMICNALCHKQIARDPTVA
ncbi:MAG: hypothetical protein OXG65_16880 [Chloroflexi bacterium]|nr:hypothetical protein [Chloroflexota bacterium]